VTDATPDAVPEFPDAPPSASPSRQTRWPHIAMMVAFGVLYSYYAWDALRTMFALPAEYAAANLPTSSVPWALLVAVLLLPIVFYIAAALLGRRRSIGRKALLFTVALGAVSCLTLTGIAFAQLL
jgi:hypothetical protein